ncbi:transmembrane reductase CYB561D2 isoform X1 [Tachysurus fulvidraco]|uniref:transmembrane reductase CYB561D2 isoform X1 n=1 Tax=Tachysurus fulvidraco TaxID=1234273 RepID=UPI000F4DA0CC|nr:transmembrane reductase CYB561D2 isoform X1 [Tachysurus fulvidraco]XP_026993191.1 transmembrane reductase CYB561D2 isoform X1 [Tachysurus fulvidraco]
MLHSESESSPYRFTRLLCGVFTHLLCAAFTMFVTFVAKPGSSLFSWHPFLMTLAFSFFMTEAVLLFSPYSSPARKLKHQVKSRLHWILQCSCSSCALVGLGTIFYNKHMTGKPHFSTWHGLLGLITVCVVLLQSAAALPLIYHKLAKGWSLAKLKRYHAAAGLVTYLLGSASLLLGVCSAWFTSSVGGTAWYITALCPALSALTIMSQVTNAYMAKKRLRS